MEVLCRQALQAGFPVAVSMVTKAKHGKVISGGSSVSLRCESQCVSQIEIPVFKGKDQRSLRYWGGTLFLRVIQGGKVAQGYQLNYSNTATTMTNMYRVTKE